MNLCGIIFVAVYKKENNEMIRKHRCLIIGFFLLGFFLSGCPKKIPGPVIEKPLSKNPIETLLETFSSVESLQARASIRIETVRMGEGMNFLLNGYLLYQKPDKLRLLGYHPLGMGLFDALYRNGEFFLLIPIQKRAYTGEVSQFEDLIEKAGAIQISSEKSEGSDIPNRIRIDVVEKETHIELRLKEISINSSLPEDAFQWAVPDGVEVRPLTGLLKGKKSR
jgi:outer membrane lipoprotein-sorting protein